MQIDFEMTFIVQGFHMELREGWREKKKKWNEMSTMPLTAKFMRIVKEHTADKQLPRL